MNVHTRHIPSPEKLVGGFRRFGIEGPVYEIVAVGAAAADGDVFMTVKVVETGETLPYRFTHILNDPKEA
ncbi:MAG TPA: hypothetical protein DCL54_08195 [Alphaproteobacteria bacterium]|nr:hypothetical protein [Alphaproteobacteria bacterium]